VIVRSEKESTIVSPASREELRIGSAGSTRETEREGKSDHERFSFVERDDEPTSKMRSNSVDPGVGFLVFPRKILDEGRARKDQVPVLFIENSPIPQKYLLISEEDSSVH